MTTQNWIDSARKYPWTVCLAPGCHRDPVAPTISRHRTLRAAVAAARKSDRLVVEPATTSVIIWRAPERGSRTQGTGLYGEGPKRGEPRLSECIAAAQAAASQWDPSYPQTAQ